MPMPEYADVILELAKAEEVCRGCKDGLTRQQSKHSTVRGETDQLHEVCGGAGRIPLFPKLRVPCDHMRENEGTAEPWTHETCMCQGRDWVPEPDVRVAAWEVFKSLPNRIKRDIVDLPLDDGADCWEGAVFQAGLAYAKEKGYA